MQRMTPGERKLKQQLKDLSIAVGRFLRQLDDLMVTPDSYRKGKEIAVLANKLELSNDHARFFALGVDYREDSLEKKLKEVGL